jgi:hypothetical protein
VDASENDPDLQAKQQAGLLALAARTLALPLGRGAAALGTLRALPGEPLRPPPLCLSGLASEAPRCVVALDLANATAAPGAAVGAQGCPLRFRAHTTQQRPAPVPKRQSCTLQMQASAGRGACAARLGRAPSLTRTPLLCAGSNRTDPSDAGTYSTHPLPVTPGAGAAAELTAWPEFHNGVASALSLATVSPAASGGGGAAGGVFGRAWVDVARQDGPSYAQAGLLMALGLRGQLEQLTWTDLYRWPGGGGPAHWRA